MEVGKDTRVVLLGAGNVAHSLAPALQEHCRLEQIFSRTKAHALALAERCNCLATDNVDELVDDAHIYIVSVSDNAIAPLLERVNRGRDALWLHTSGSTPINVFGERFPRHGVLYPMQSFSRAIAARIDEVHFFIEGNTPASTAGAHALAALLSPHVHEADSHTREQLHLAAVFACNFPNHLFSLASDILHDAGLPFDVVLPLIKNMVDKLNHLSPQASQTGPAARGDTTIINRHLAALEGDKNKQAIYQLLTNSIMHYGH